MKILSMQRPRITDSIYAHIPIAVVALLAAGPAWLIGHAPPNRQ